MKHYKATILNLIYITITASLAAACTQKTTFGSSENLSSSSSLTSPSNCTSTAFGMVCNPSSTEGMTGTTSPTPPGAHVYFYQLSPTPNAAGAAATEGQYAGQNVAGSMNMFNPQSLVPNLTAYTSQVNVPDQMWTNGFPGNPNLQEWFGLCYDGTWKAPSSGAYTFVTAADDAVAIWIDGQLIGENDGGTVYTTNEIDLGTPFSPNPVAFQPINVTAGDHQIKIMYYQGWPKALEIQIWALAPGQTFTTGTTPADSNLLQISSPANGALNCPH